MTNISGGAEAKIISVEDLYSDLKKSLKESKGGDTGVLPILERDLLHPKINEKEDVAKSLKDLLALAASRAQSKKSEVTDGNTSKT